MHPETYSDQAVPRLELEGVLRVVDEGEAGRLSSSELGAEAEDDDLVLGSLVHGRELVPELVLGDVGTSRVEDIDDHLLALKETVGQELAGANGDGAGGVL